MTRKMNISVAALITAALFAGSASAAIVLDDAQWGSMAIDTPNPAFNGIITGSDIAGDPGYQWDMTINKVIEPYGLLNIAATTGTLGLSVTPGEGWDVEFNNPIAASIGVLLTAYVTGAEATSGLGYTGWVTQMSATIIPAGTQSVSWNLSTGLNEAQDDAVLISSISKLGVTFVGDTGGSVGGEDLSLQVVPEPATLAMVGLFGGGLLVVRRLFSI